MTDLDKLVFRQKHAKDMHSEPGLPARGQADSKQNRRWQQRRTRLCKRP